MSRKLIGAMAGMVAVVAIVAFTAFRVVDKETALLAIVSVTGLGGFQVYRQAVLDAAKENPDAK